MCLGTNGPDYRPRLTDYAWELPASPVGLLLRMGQESDRILMRLTGAHIYLDDLPHHALRRVIVGAEDAVSCPRVLWMTPGVTRRQRRR